MTGIGVFAMFAVAVPCVASSTALEPLVLAVGGIVGAFARAFFIKHQNKWGRETVFDCFLGLLLGLLWTVPAFGVWPPFDFSPASSYVQRAAIVAIVAMVAVEIVKRILIRWAPEFLERRLRAVLPNGNGATPPPPPS